MGIRIIDHINIDTCKPEETVAFYSNVLGLESRPKHRAANNPGAWMYSGDRAIVHLNFHDASPAGPTGAFNHAAFEGSDFQGTCRALEAHGIDYRVQERTDISLKQIFLEDPNGVKLEINISGE